MSSRVGWQRVTCLRDSPLIQVSGTSWDQEELLMLPMMPMAHDDDGNVVVCLQSMAK